MTMAPAVIAVDQFSKLPDELLEATAQHDDSFMNFTLGSLLDSMNETQARMRNITPESRKLYAIYADETLL